MFSQVIVPLIKNADYLMFQLSNRAQVVTCHSQIVSNHLSRFYPCCSRKRNKLSGKSSLLMIELAIPWVFSRNMKRNMDDTGIVLSHLHFFPSSRFLLHPLLLHFSIPLVGIVLGLSTCKNKLFRGQQLALFYLGLKEMT